MYTVKSIFEMIKHVISLYAKPKQKCQTKSLNMVLIVSSLDPQVLSAHWHTNHSVLIPN